MITISGLESQREPQHRIYPPFKLIDLVLAGVNWLAGLHQLIRTRAHLLRVSAAQ